MALTIAAAMVIVAYTSKAPVLAAGSPALLVIVIWAVIIPGVILGWLSYAGRVGVWLRLKPYLVSVIVLFGSAFMALQLAADHAGWLPPDGLWAWTDVIVLYIYTVLVVALAIVVGINRWKVCQKRARNAS